MNSNLYDIRYHLKPEVLHVSDNLNHGIQNCGYTVNYEWGDYVCSNLERYICETGCEYISLKETIIIQKIMFININAVKYTLEAK